MYYMCWYIWAAEINIAANEDPNIEGASRCAPRRRERAGWIAGLSVCHGLWWACQRRASKLFKAPSRSWYKMNDACDYVLLPTRAKRSMRPARWSSAVVRRGYCYIWRGRRSAIERWRDTTELGRCCHSCTGAAAIASDHGRWAATVLRSAL